MTRRPVLPGASELFRRTDTKPDEAEVTELPSMSAATSSPALRGRRAEAGEPTPGMPLTLVPGGASGSGAASGPASGSADALAAFRAPTAPAVPTAQPLSAPGPLKRGRPARTRVERTKHDEKITVYISADELLALESARLSLRAQHGVAADRGRIVREAVSVLLADLAERGEESVLVRRLKGS
ncbi:hypothetical protein OF117_06565 [Geodermatophilus sp. YIM 151500]|uniref:hypothetical protein n=1 Tax=Geodermatophilus sp. YIM 151500 TaxID=2984531 RepID=UPI0021E3A16E|nr:hypothetical protein [Geodermatophilus sp. YIM 151500]MCV2489021.1 hypothetical protein [Geodermatophilus sp. YIM 151500]